MEARNRAIPIWFEQLNSARLRLPRFQRFEAWGHSEVAGLLEVVLRGLPVGATLILNVGDKEQFQSRAISGASLSGERCTEHLLDGQQRLTALWKSLNDLYDDRTYLVWLEKDAEHDNRLVPRVHGIARWRRGGQRYPLWVNEPKEVYRRGYFPLSLLRPGDTARDIQAWCDVVSDGDRDRSRDVENEIRPLRERILTFNMPYLELPATTPPDIAVDVFLKMNTSSVRLTAFDIIVARLENETGQSLHQLVQGLIREVPSIPFYQSPQNLILSSAAMRQDRTPTQASFHRLDLQSLADEWPALVDGLRWSIGILEEESVYDDARLPTVAVVPVLAALHEHIPEKLDARGRAMVLIRSYIWRAFITHRYDNSVSSRSLQDLRSLREALTTGSMAHEAPIFDEGEFPLPRVEELVRVGWPNRRDTLARAILALSLKQGARDFADDEKVTREHLRHREYHHLFPRHLLEEEGKLQGGEPYRALNCALITWSTNRAIAAKEPLRYLRERTCAAALGEEEVRRRLRSHLVPYDELAVGGYAEAVDPVERARRVSEDYDAFLLKRATEMRAIMERLCRGETWPSVE